MQESLNNLMELLAKLKISTLNMSTSAPQDQRQGWNTIQTELRNLAAAIASQDTMNYCTDCYYKADYEDRTNPTSVKEAVCEFLPYTEGDEDELEDPKDC